MRLQYGAMANHKLSINKMSKVYKFDALIHEGDGGGAYVIFPYSVEQEFGVKGRLPIKATIDGEPYRGSLFKYGMPEHMLLILKSIREKLDKQVGDRVSITIQHDVEDRKIESPADFKKLLKANKLLEAFEKMNYTHQREWMQWLEGAKKAETRERRLHQAIEKLKAK